MTENNTLDIGITREEIDYLAKWHHECEKNFADMLEYELAQFHKDRTHLFDGLKNSGPYLKLG